MQSLSAQAFKPYIFLVSLKGHFPKMILNVKSCLHVNRGQLLLRRSCKSDSKDRQMQGLERRWEGTWIHRAGGVQGTCMYTCMDTCACSLKGWK